VNSLFRCEFKSRIWGVVLDTKLCDKDCQWLATGRRFSPGTPVSSTNTTDSHDITETLLKVALITITLTHRYVWGIMYTLLKYINVKHHSSNSLYFIFLSFFIFSSHQIIDYLLLSFCTSFCLNHIKICVYHSTVLELNALLFKISCLFKVNVSSIINDILRSF
jgi:hypothetical protein